MSRINITVAVESESAQNGIKTEVKKDFVLSSILSDLDRAQITRLTESTMTWVISLIRLMELPVRYAGLLQRSREQISDPIRMPPPSRPQRQRPSHPMPLPTISGKLVAGPTATDPTRMKVALDDEFKIIPPGEYVLVLSG